MYPKKSRQQDVGKISLSKIPQQTKGMCWMEGLKVGSVIHCLQWDID